MASGSRPLRVASAFPDPPFEVPGPPASGLDIELGQAIAAKLGRPYESHPYEGRDGHRWHLVDDQPWRRVYVTLD